MKTYHIFILVFTSLLSIGYLNLSFCTSNDEFESAAQRIWPNISDNHSLLQWPLPGLTGDGLLDISFYDIFAKVVNETRYIPWHTIRKSNFTLLQVGIMFAVGAMACGAASALAEAILYHEQEKHHHHHKRVDGVPLPLVNFPTSYEFSNDLPAIRSSKHYSTSKDKSTYPGLNDMLSNRRFDRRPSAPVSKSNPARLSSKSYKHQQNRKVISKRKNS